MQAAVGRCLARLAVAFAAVSCCVRMVKGVPHVPRLPTWLESVAGTCATAEELHALPPRAAPWPCCSLLSFPPFALLVCAAFLDRLRIELRLQGQLQGLGLGPGTVQRLLETRLDHDPSALSDLRLDLSPMKHVSDAARLNSQML